jgi:hypothetical protein
MCATFSFSGTRMITIANVRLQNLRPGYQVRKSEVEDGGDGTVPAWSSSITGFQTQLVGGEHGTIYKDKGLKRTLVALLGKPGVLALVQSVELYVRDHVIEPGANLHVSLLFPARATEVHGELRFEPLQVDGSGSATLIPPPPDFVFSIGYKGVAAETMAFQCPGPNVRGMYRVAFYQNGEATPSANDELFVQS